MPLDAQGNFRHNHEAAQMHSQAAGKSYGEKETKPEGDSEHVEIHPHGDGTFHTMHKGEQVEHESHGHALIHAAKVHAEEGHKHFHAHHDGESMKSHSVEGGGESESRDHEDETGAHEHLSEVMGGEPDGDEGEAQPEMAGKGLGGLY
jgi:hypothetical protein